MFAHIICSIRSYSDAITQSGLGCNDNESVFPRDSLTGVSPSDGLMTYQGPSLGKSYSSAEMQPVYTNAPTDWVGYGRSFS